MPQISARSLLSHATRFGAWTGLVALACLVGACTEMLDAGHSRRLPVDARNPVILYQDDWSGDWLGPYAVLFAANGGPRLAAIVVNASKIWTDLNINAGGWKDFVTATRSSGLQNVPEVTPSEGAPLTRPSDGQIESTVANRSAGAQLIVDVSRQLGTASLPAVVVSGTSLTDVADAYLVDPTVIERVVVIASLGSHDGSIGMMDQPNGDMDPWADWIVAQRFRYIQVSAHYDQTGDVTEDDVPNLPQNTLGSRMASVWPQIIRVPSAADQVALLAVALPKFVVTGQRVSPDTSARFDSMQGPTLLPDASGDDWLVTQIDGVLPRPHLWQMLLDPQTFSR